MYYYSEDFNNMTYSVDMIRLKTYIDFNTYNVLEFYFKVVCKEKVKNFWISDRIMQFKYNFVIEVEEGRSIYIGFFHNNEKGKNELSYFNLTIEFNPNKLKDNHILKYILDISGKWYLRSLDLAIDLKINILDVIVDNSGRLSMDIKSYGFDNKTISFGKGDGRVKIYNKKIESNLNIMGDLTRVEISRTFDDFDISNIKDFYFGDFFPVLYLQNYLYTFSDYKDKTVLALLYAVQSGYPLKDLSRSYKLKVKSMLEGGNRIFFDEKVASSVVRQTIFKYFIKNNKVKWR